ncbi:MAG: glycosyltransferase family 4 protein [Candidatus Freyarchaeota archaeon]|nr:glycosyltransferase family 4 protein [Candidatus Jordarchaeia archaeon]
MVAMEFLERVRERGHKVSVLLGDCRESFDGDIDFYSVPRWGFLSWVIGSPYPVFRNVSDLIKIVNPDVVHVNSHLFFCNYQAVKASRLLRIPCVVTVHGFMVERSFVWDAMQGVYLWTVAKSLFEKVSAVICLTEHDAASVGGIVGGYEKIFVIPNGVDSDFFKPSSLKDSNLITWVGRLVPEKGLVYLLHAMREIVRVHPDVKLVVIGGGPLETRLVKLADELGLSGNVRFVGSVGRVDVVRFLSRSSVFVFPSLREGLPLSVLEAMACGVPIVGSDIPGVNGLVKHGYNGLLVPPKDSGLLAQAVLTLLTDDKLRMVMGVNARRIIVDKYSWDKVIQKLEGVYCGATAEFGK